MDIDSFPCSGSDLQKAPRLNQDAYEPVNYICPEAYALLAAAEASATHSADALDARVMDLGVNGSGLTLQGPLDGMYDPDRVLKTMAPPKKFYRTFWISVTLRLLDRWSRTVALS